MHHHAYLLIGSLDEAEARFKELCTELGVEVENNPDFFAFRQETLGIDEARALSSFASGKAFTGKKIIFLVPGKMTLEAQNALLKTLEDPTSNTHFFLCVGEEGQVIPTLRSRMSIERVSRGKSGVVSAEKFLKLDLKKRLEFAKKFADEGKSLGVFLDEIANVLRQKRDEKSALRSVYELRRYALDQSALPRIIIEHLALVLP